MVLLDGKCDSERKKLLICDRLWLKGSKRRLKVEDYLKWLILGGRDKTLKDESFKSLKCSGNYDVDL